MTSITFTPQTVDEIKLISTAALICESDVDAISGRYMVDAKSLLGLLSMNYSKGVDIIFHEDNDRVLFENKYTSLLGKKA